MEGSMVDYSFYRDEYRGTAIPEEQWPVLEARARNQLDRWRRSFTIQADETGEAMAICAMAESMAEYDAAGELRSASIGSVSVEYRVRGRERVLLEKAGMYLDIYRGVGS